jgi:hypothetical protein
MKQQTAPTTVRLERFAWMVALVVVLRLLAWDLHHALDYHAEADEYCQVCLVMERGGDGVAAVAAKMLSPQLALAPTDLVSDPDYRAQAYRPLPRGPPSLLS